jgi:hypothetical protein
MPSPEVEHLVNKAIYLFLCKCNPENVYTCEIFCLHISQLSPMLLTLVAGTSCGLNFLAVSQNTEMMLKGN